MIPLFRSIVTSSPTLGPLVCVPNVYHVVVRMAPRAIAASVGSGGGNALTSTFFGGTVSGGRMDDIRLMTQYGSVRTP